MNERAYTNVDKSSWMRGPWDYEPDKVQFTTRAGLPGLIVRNPMGALCGYVGLADGHPFFGIDYSGCVAKCGFGRWDEESPCTHVTPDSAAYAHGGLTFSGFCQPDSEELGICHVPEPGEPDHVWWLGFDCAHGGDVLPARPRDFWWSPDAAYRSIGYVREQVESLGAQLAEVNDSQADGAR